MADHRGRHQPVHHTGLHGGAKQVALGLLASFAPQQPDLLVRFDALRAGVHAQAMTEIDNCPNDASCSSSRNEAMNERSILILSNGKLLEVAQTRISGAEIVHRDFYTNLLELLEGP